MNRRALVENLALLSGVSLGFVLLIEAGYRIFDPFPYIGAEEINRTEHGNLSMHDPLLGWTGVRGGKAELVTENRSVWLANNSEGFRDVEHDESGDKPAIVFLGDSFTWGYAVEFDEMFVNRLRGMLPGYELFNLSHRGYGTDQELLTFTRWRNRRPLRLAVLMFCENDVGDNDSDFRYDKPKPRYRLVGDDLVLTGVPVPRTEEWKPSVSPAGRDSWRARLKKLLFRSHFLHDVSFRYGQLRSPDDPASAKPETSAASLLLTARILEELKKEVEGRGGKLVVMLIPSKREIERWDDSPPYQIEIGEICRKHGIESFDLAPDFKSTWYRTYYRMGGHWNARGNQVAADAIFRYLSARVTLR